METQQQGTQSTGSKAAEPPKTGWWKEFLSRLGVAIGESLFGGRR